MFKHLSIKFRLIFVIVFLSTVLLGIGILGLLGMTRTNEDMNDVYRNRTIPLGQIKQIELLLQQDRFTTTIFLAAPTPEILSNNIARLENNIAEVAMILETYKTADLIPEERALLEQFSSDNTLFVTEALMPVMDAWRDGEYRTANGIIADKVSKLYRPVSIGVDQLSGMQVELARKKYEQAQLRYGRIRSIFLVAITLGLGMAIWLGFVLVRAIVHPLNHAVMIAHAVAAGDLTSKISFIAQDEAGRLLQALQDMNGNLIKLVGNVRASADSIGTASKEIATGDIDLSQRTEEQASSLQETASSMEALTATVKQNAEHASQANQLGLGARDVAMKGGEVVNNVITTMSSINESSRKIVDIIAVIEGIAFQTNILALNAAVEAARAGEQGRGFAVVAAEVRMLAQRSAVAAQEIKVLIGDSVKKVEGGTLLVDEAGKTMEEIVSAVKCVTDIMTEISAASFEQSVGIDQINKAIARMDEVTQQNAALVEEVAAAAKSMEEEADRLTGAVSVFKLVKIVEPKPRQIAASPAAKQAPVPTVLLGRPDAWYKNLAAKYGWEF